MAASVKPSHDNIVEFMVYGSRALFSDPLNRTSGQHFSYPVPTYEALKGILSSVYWKPSIIWYIDEVRVMNPIETESSGITALHYLPDKKSNYNLCFHTYLRNPCYQVRAHFEWNANRPGLMKDWNENKHHSIAKRMIRQGGRRDVFLGTRECQAFVEPCVFGEGAGFYDNEAQIRFDFMEHGFTYPDESYDETTEGMITENFWTPVMEHGVIRCCRPEECPHHRTIRPAVMKEFHPSQNVDIEGGED